MSEQTLIK